MGPQPDGRVVVPTNQVLQPAGKQVLLPGRPTDLALSPDGRWLAVANDHEIILLDAASGAAVSDAAISGASYKGVLFSPDSRELYVSTIPGKKKTGGAVAHFEVGTDGELKRRGEIKFDVAGQEAKEQRPLAADDISAFGTKHLPAGMAWTPGGHELLVALNLANHLVVVDRRTDKVLRRIPVGNAPYDVAVVGSKAYVTNFAGRIPRAGDTVGPSGVGRPVRVDSVRNIASDGSVSVVDWQQGRMLKEIVVGPHASAIAATVNGGHVAISCGNDDLVWIVDTNADRVVEKISVRPSKELLFGRAPGASDIQRRRQAAVCGLWNKQRGGRR